MNNITAGDLCFIDKVSPYSIARYDSLKAKLPEIICPCSIPSTQELRVTDDLGLSVLVQYTNNPLKLSVILKKDLRKKSNVEITKTNS